VAPGVIGICRPLREIFSQLARNHGGIAHFGSAKIGFKNGQYITVILRGVADLYMWGDIVAMLERNSRIFERLSGETDGLVAVSEDPRRQLSDRPVESLPLPERIVMKRMWLVGRPAKRSSAKSRFGVLTVDRMVSLYPVRRLFMSERSGPSDGF
jgi:hypothetical protein